jgi:acetolactate decarboxylase
MKKIGIVVILCLVSLLGCKEKEVEHKNNNDVEIQSSKEVSIDTTSVQIKELETPVVEGDKRIYKVSHKGSLMEIMKGNLGATISLKDLEYIPNLYGIGAVENLKGEILIMGGKPIVSRRSEEMVTIENSYDVSATLLVYAQVNEWIDITIPAMVKSQGQFEIFLQQQADRLGIDTTKPFPFILTGGIAKLNWHIVNWDESVPSHSAQSHMQTGLNGLLAHANLDILGFYDRNNDGVFVHKGSKTHMHFKAQHANLAAHVDSMFLGRDLTLKLPKM